jgi:Fic family protein
MRVIKRKKGTKEYNYLQYSFRQDKKIITREKYLGADIPYNLEEIKEEFRKESRLELYKKLEKISKNFQNEWKRMPKSAKEKEKQEISIAFTYNTNAIEGSKITLGDAREIIENHISPNKPLGDVKETEEHNNVFLKMLDKKENITNNLLLSWHKNIFGKSKEDIAGFYREYLVRVGNYLAPDWQEVKGLMDKLLSFIESSKLNPVELSARAHYRFEKIHPFSDGNGRIGRLLMNYILWHKGYPMVIIEYKRRKSYYAALNKDEEYFVNYFFRRYLAVHKNRLKYKVRA